MTIVEPMPSQSQAEFVYSVDFTNRFLGWLLTTKDRTALTFARKYHTGYRDPARNHQTRVMRHEDVTEFIVGKLPQLLQVEPELLAPRVWADETSLYAAHRARFFTIYRNYCINRWHRYKRIHTYELDIEPQETDLITDTSPSSRIAEAMTYRRLWNTHVEAAQGPDKVVALYLLSDSLEVDEAVALSGLSRRTFFRRVADLKQRLAVAINHQEI